MSPSDRMDLPELNTHRKTIIFVISVNSEYPTQLPIAVALARSGITPLLCFNNVSNDLKLELQDCRGRGLHCFQLFSDRVSEPSSLTTSFYEKSAPCHEDRRNKAEWTIRKQLSSLVFGRRVIQRFRKVLKARNIKLAVVSNNKLEFLHPYLFRAIRLQGGRIVMLPFGFENRKSYLAKLSRKCPRLHGVICVSMMKLIFGKWIFHDGTNWRIPVPVHTILSLIALRSAPYVPLSPYGGRADVILAESPFMLDFYGPLTSGKTQILLTGAPYCDSLFNTYSAPDAFSKKLREKYHIQDSLKLVIVSMPQYMSGYWPGATGKRKYLEFANTFFSDLCDFDSCFVPIVSIHPRMKSEEILKIAGSHPSIRIVSEEIASLIAVCSFYIACESSTIRMAVACEKPSINYDIYSFDFDLYPVTLGVKTITSRDDFRTTLREYARGGGEFKNHSRRLRKVSQHFAPKDARAGERIVSALTAFC